jgi:hypothetical protein
MDAALEDRDRLWLKRGMDVPPSVNRSASQIRKSICFFREILLELHSEGSAPINHYEFVPSSS